MAAMQPGARFLAARTPAPMAERDGGRRSWRPSQSEPLELGDGLIEPLAAEPGLAQCGTKVAPVEELRARRRLHLRDAGFYEHPLDVLLPPAIYVAHGAGRLRVRVRPGAHADLQHGGARERAAQECIEALLARLVPLDVGDDRLGCHRSPVLDRPGMKGAEVGEVPIEAATRDAELAGQHVRLECIRALVRERGQCEIDPVLRRQPSAHTAAPYTAVLTPTMRRHSPSRTIGERGGRARAL